MIYELRQYTMVPGRRDDFVEIFDREFVESQEALGIRVVGQFRDLDNENRYVWVRAFPDMDARERALTAFYDGPVWAEHKDTANATMTEWHDVLLMTPAWARSGLAHDPSQRAAVGAESEPGEGISVTVWRAEPGMLGDIAETYRKAWPDALAALRTEHSPNTYPRLPIREGETVFAGIRRGLADQAEPLSGAGKTLQLLRLEPTGRSLLR